MKENYTLDTMHYMASINALISRIYKIIVNQKSIFGELL